MATTATTIIEMITHFFIYSFISYNNITQLLLMFFQRRRNITLFQSHKLVCSSFCTASFSSCIKLIFLVLAEHESGTHQENINALSSQLFRLLQKQYEQIVGKSSSDSGPRYSSSCCPLKGGIDKDGAMENARAFYHHKE